MILNRCVVLGDVIKSRAIEDRTAFHDRLQAGLATLNEEFNSCLDASMQVLKGVDEVGGVLETPAQAYAIARRLQDELFPREIRTVAVHGEIDVTGEVNDVASMDGPAFHNADSHLNRLAEEGMLFWVALDGSPMAELVSMAGNATLTLRNDWTDREHEIVRTYERLGTQTAAAEHLDVGQPTVSKALSRTHWKRLDQIEGTINQVLQEVPTGGHES